MIRYFKQYFRTLRKQSRLSLLIFLTLTTGFISSYFVYAYISYELTYDDHLSDQLYRVNMETSKNGEFISKTARTAPPVGPLITDVVSGTESFSRLVLMGEVIILNDETTVREKDVLLADRSYFEQFEFSWIDGDAQKMDEPNLVAISSTLANKIFGLTDVVGKNIEINSPNFEGTYPFTVSGVFEDHNGHSHLEPELLISYATLHGFVGQSIDQSWNWNNIFTYIKANGDPVELTAQINHAFQEIRGKDLENRDLEIKLSLQPVRDIHTDSSYDGEFSKPIDSRQLLYLGLLAFFILVMTYTNFVNLFLVNTVGKRREMAVRTVLGASGNGIMRHTLTDIIVFHGISALLTITAIQVLSPYVIHQFSLPSQILPELIVQLAIIGTLSLAGIAISFLLTYARFSGVKWTANLSGKRTTASRSDIRWYSSLLATQLAIAVFFIAGAVVVFHQLTAITAYDPGVNLENKIVFKAPLMGSQDGIENYKEVMWSQLSSQQHISDLVMANEIPGSEIYWRMDNVGRQPNQPSPITFSWLAVSDGYIDFFEIPLLAGRDFDRQADTFNSSVILNKSGADLMGFEDPMHAIDQVIYLGEHPVTIIGVVDDYYQENLREGVDPLFLRFGAEGLNYYVINTTGQVDMAKVGEAYQNVFTDAPFDYFDLREHYEKQYAGERLLAHIILWMAIIALFIAVSGIIGISLQILERRSKELIIKKIHGASAFELWKDVAVSFYRISFLALLAGLPLSYYVFKSWLGQYVVADFPMVYFALVPVVVLALVLFLSITRQILRTTRQNPQEVLVSE
jgi:putative ABC transport system permease protein